MQLRSRLAPVVFFVVAVATPGSAQQWTAEKRGSDNLEIVSHLPLGPRLSVADIDIEQLPPLKPPSLKELEAAEKAWTEPAAAPPPPGEAWTVMHMVRWSSAYLEQRGVDEARLNAELLLAHCIDTAIWLNGSIDDVTAMTETFVKERMHTLTGKVEPVAIDDACAFLARFKNGSLATFESTRYARGHKALYTFEINGEHASIQWDLHDLHRLNWFNHSDESIVRGWRSIHVTDGDMPYMDKWWVPGLQIGYEHTFVHQVADFLKSLKTGTPCGPTFRDALETQKVCDAVLASAKERSWRNV